MKSIVRRSMEVATFIGLLGLTFTAPQMRHLERLADLLVLDTRRKTLAQMCAEELDGVDPSNLADFFRISPWETDHLRLAVLQLIIRYLKEHNHDFSKPIYLTIDDSLAVKDRGTKCLEAVDWHYDHNRHYMVRASCHVVLGIHWGDFHFPLSWRLYLRQCTVRKRNRKRPGEHKLRYVSKLELARQMLAQVLSLLPADRKVYVLFDSWYTSAKLVSWIRCQGWHVIAGIKSNRKLSGQSLTAWHHEDKGRRYENIRLRLANGRWRTYRVRSHQGRLRGIPGDVRVLISQKGNKGQGARAPKYFLCTDLNLSARKILQYYQLRWSQEVDYWFAKLRLGLADFRLQSLEATEKWYAVVYLVLAYLYWQQYESQEREQRAMPLSEIIERLRRDHERTTLRQALEEVAAGASVEEVLARYIGPPGRKAA